MIPHEGSVLWGHYVKHFTTNFSTFIDLAKSTPQLLVPTQEGWVQALMEPKTSVLDCMPGETITLPVKVTNNSKEPFPYGELTFGLSYHLLTSEGAIITFGNARSYFPRPLQPEESLMAELLVQAPNVSGSYIVELDLVWEGMLWFKESGNPTVKVELVVRLKGD